MMKKWSEMYQRGYDNAAVRFAYIPDFKNEEQRLEFQRGMRDGFERLDKIKRKGKSMKRNPGESSAFWGTVEERKKEGRARAQSNRARLENEVRTRDRFQASWAMRNMIKALGMMQWQNTVEDWQRLFEAKIVMAARSRMGHRRMSTWYRR